MSLFESGYDACMSGAMAEDCPYRTGSMSEYEWQRGFQAAWDEVYAEYNNTNG